MASPFPGMDPYLEGDMWQEFHHTLAGAIRAQLMSYITPKYVALLSRRYVVGVPAELGIVGREPVHTIYPDVGISSAETVSNTMTQTSNIAIAEPVTELVNLLPEKIPVLNIEIRDIAQRRLVTVIELLSPANKIGKGYQDYEERRTQILQTETHLLEIDLLRRGERIAVSGLLPPAHYYIYLSRFQRRPAVQIWHIQLQEKLPTVPVPLLPPDSDVPLDLQSVVHDCFELVGYERLLDYTSSPPPPELSQEDAEWIRKCVG